MKIKSARDFWSGLMFIVLGVLFALGAAYYPMGPPCPPADACASSVYARFAQLSTHPGAGFMPLGLGLLLALLGAVVLFKSLTIESEDGEAIGAIAWRPVLATVVAIVAFGLLLEPLGLVLTIPVLVAATSLAEAGRSWRGVLADAVFLSLGAWIFVACGWMAKLPLWPSFITG
ncbi:MAG: tripartite tricarboxylate transporter TctB family protein [Pseudomonadota bacterium]|nr:tripartite tricarboxylate transporter TctB family protein [Pseudomonadota bacterium]